MNSREIKTLSTQEINEVNAGWGIAGAVIGGIAGAYSGGRANGVAGAIVGGVLGAASGALGGWAGALWSSGYRATAVSAGAHSAGGSILTGIEWEKRHAS